MFELIEFEQESIISKKLNHTKYENLSPMIKNKIDKNVNREELFQFVFFENDKKPVIVTDDKLENWDIKKLVRSISYSYKDGDKKWQGIVQTIFITTKVSAQSLRIDLGSELFVNYTNVLTSISLNALKRIIIKELEN